MRAFGWQAAGGEQARGSERGSEAERESESERYLAPAWLGQMQKALNSMDTIDPDDAQFGSGF